MDMFGAITQAVGGIVSAAGSVQQADTMEADLKNQAKYAILAADEEANVATRGSMGQRATGVAQRAASGVTSGGSVGMVDDAIVQEIALADAKIRHGGKLEANQLQNEARAARQASNIQTQTTLMSAGSTSASMLQGRFGSSATRATSGGTRGSAPAATTSNAGGFSSFRMPSLNSGLRYG